MSALQGRIVRVRTFAWAAGTHADAAWWVAIDDDALAVKAVMMAARTRADEHGVDVVGRLSAEQIAAAGLSDGRAVPAPD
jgi:hypothetical protein